MRFLIADAFAATPTTPPAASGYSTLIMLGLFMVIFYFMLLRPQQKRAKEHRKMLEALSKGDEVITNGGLVGKVTKIRDNFVSLQISDTVEIKVQKGAIAATLPKGTMKAE